MSKSLNRVTLIGNLARDPEVKFTPSGSAVCTFSIATNRSWKTESGEQKDSVEFHRIVAWDKLGEICGQYLKKGMHTFVEGRLQTRKWAGQDGVDRYTTEIVITDMIMLGSRGSSDYGSAQGGTDQLDVPADFGQAEQAKPAPKASTKSKKKEEVEAPVDSSDDIPF